MDMNKILQNMDSAEKGTYEAGKTDSSEMKTILESFYDVAAEGSAPQQLDEIASVTMSGDSADEVAQLVKLMNDAGAPEAAPVGAQPTTMLEPTPCGASDGPPDMPPKADMITPKMMDDFDSAEEVIQDEYANEPDERYDDHGKMTHDLSGGLNRQKGAYAAAQDGDNAMAVESKLKEELSKMLKQKMSEKKDQDGDGDNDFDDVKIARMKASGMSHEEAVAKVKGDSDTNEDIDVAEDDDPCWKNYKMVGMKKGKGGKEVPNCVPKEGVEETAKKKNKEVEEEKKKGVDGKACWDGYRYAGKEQKADGTYKDKCVKVNNSEYSEGATDTKQKMKQIVSAFKPISKSEKVVKAFSYKPYKDTESIPAIITKDPKVDEESDYPFALYIKSNDSSEMLHHEYYDDMETAISDAKFAIKDAVDRPADGPAPGQQRLPFEGEAAPKNNPVAKHAGKFNKAQVQTDRKKEQKKGKSVKHKGKDMAMESAPVFERYVKPFLNKSPKQMVEFYDSEARTIIKRLGEERIQLQKQNSNTKVHDTVLAQLRENLGVLSEAPYRGRRRSSFDIGRTGYGPGGDLGAADKRDFKRREMEIELGDEESNNYGVSIGGKPWKVFRSQRAAQKAANTIKSKYGKDTKVYLTGAPATS